MLLQLLALFWMLVMHFFGFTKRLIYTYKIWVAADPMFFSHMFIVKYKRRRRRSREMEGRREHRGEGEGEMMLVRAKQ